MNRTSISTLCSNRVFEKFNEAKIYLKANVFIRSNKHLLEDIENSYEK